MTAAAPKPLQRVREWLAAHYRPLLVLLMLLAIGGFGWSLAYPFFPNAAEQDEAVAVILTSAMMQDGNGIAVPSTPGPQTLAFEAVMKMPWSLWPVAANDPTAACLLTQCRTGTAPLVAEYAKYLDKWQKGRARLQEIIWNRSVAVVSFLLSILAVAISLWPKRRRG